MKDIKFRAWDEMRKTLTNNIVSFKFHREGTPNLIVYTKNKIKIGMEINSDDKILSNEFHLMQFIGLKDKNGKEIFEGDIVKIDEFIFNIEFIGGAFHLRDKKGIFDITRLDETKIIGNIYENPELLGGTNEHKKND